MVAHCLGVPGMLDISLYIIVRHYDLLGLGSTTLGLGPQQVWDDIQSYT